MKLDQSEDNEVANIYQKILRGEKNALNNLQKLSNSPFKKPLKSPVQNYNFNQQQQKQRKSSQQHNQIKNNLNISKASRSQNFRKYLHQKVNQLKVAQPGSKKQIIQKVNKEEKKEYAQPKPFSKMRKRSDARSQQKAPEPQLGSSKQLEKVPKNKTKTTSNTFQQHIAKNIIKDTEQDKAITEKDRHSQVPSSNHSFRVRAQGGKKLLQQLIKLNEEERRLQVDILQFHKENKDYISEVCDKFGIKKLAPDYVKLGDTINIGVGADESEFMPIDKVKSKSTILNEQQQRIIKLKRQISALSKQIQTKKNQIQKKQAKIDMNPLHTYINSIPDIFEQQRQSQQQNQNQVHSLQGGGEKVHDPIKTYQSLMGEMKNKKWGLNQRIGYAVDGMRANESKIQIEKQKGKEISKDRLEFSPLKMEGPDQDSKIVVNARLKQFLFQ